MVQKSCATYRIVIGNIPGFWAKDFKTSCFTFFFVRFAPSIQEAAEIPRKSLVGNERFHTSKPDEKIITKKNQPYEWLLTSNDYPALETKIFRTWNMDGRNPILSYLGAQKAYVQLRKC